MSDKIRYKLELEDMRNGLLNGIIRDINNNNYRVIIQKYVKNRDLQSMNNLAYMYSVGEGLKQDINKSITLYNVVIEKGDNDPSRPIGYAMNTLGHMYHHGYYVEKDIKKAKYLYLKAIEKGNKCAEYNISTLSHD